ncbi:MAG: heavy metal translocating P-type ATPase [Candidatus Hydrothermarchaeaceae archaeon]
MENIKHNDKNKESCPVCVDVEDVEAFEERPLWEGRDAAIIGVSALLLSIGLVFEVLLIEKTIAAAFFLATALLSGHGIIKDGLSSIFRGRFSIDLLMTIAASGAFLIGHGEEGAAVMFLFIIAEFLEEHASDRAKRSLHGLLELAPQTATVKRDGKEEGVHVHDIRVGDVVIVRPGEKIPLDGVVVKGSSSVNQAPITGESMPVSKEAGGDVYAATINVDGYLEVRVTKNSDETILSRIIQLVAEAQKQKSRSEKFVDKFSRYYTPTVILMAVGVAVIPTLAFGMPFNVWFYRALVLLVVSCPCALAISTPVSMVSAITSGARNGVLVKGSGYLERLGEIKAVAFDKTGTLTEGRLEVSDVVVINTLAPGEILRVSASIESHSRHPIARAIVERTQKEGLRLHQIADFKSVAGKGVAGSIDGEKYSIGSRKLFDELEVGFPEETAARLEDEGKTVVLVANERESIGIIAVSDKIREGAAEVVKSLKEWDIRVEMLTGDNERVAKAIATRLGIEEYHAELMPEDKVRIVGDELSGKYGGVAMVGDGINDAPALARADVGIAMGAMGSDVALENADIALMEDELSKLVYLIELSQKTSAVVKENILVSILVKGSFAVLALPGLVPLWLAVAVGDMGLSLAVILNAMRLSLIEPGG